MDTALVEKVILREFCALNRVTLKEGSFKGRQNREHWAFAFKTEGSTVYTSQGQDFLSDKNHVVLLPRGCSYSLVCREAGVCYMAELELEGLPVDIPVTQFRLFDTAGCLRILNRIERLRRLRQPGSEAKCRAGFYELLSLLAESNAVDDRSLRTQAILQPAVAYMEANLWNPHLRMEDIAEAADISPVYFRKLFGDAYASPPMGYVRSLRIAKAQELLAGDFTSVGDVAEACGFGDIYQFCRTFRKQTGMTPTAYAHSHGGGQSLG